MSAEPRQPQLLRSHASLSFSALTNLALAVTMTAGAELAAPWDGGPMGKLGRPAQQRPLQLSAT